MRQLKNIAEQISIIENQREISAEVLRSYLPQFNASHVPALRQDANSSASGGTLEDRELILKILRDYRNELNELKSVVYELVSNGASMTSIKPDSAKSITTDGIISITPKPIANSDIIEVEESLSLQDKEKDLILRALKKYKGKRKRAAQELGISERTLYRKINEYRIDE